MGRIESVCSVVVAFSGVGQSLDDVAPVEAPTHSFRKFSRRRRRTSPRQVRIQLEVDRLGVPLAPGRGGCGMIINCVRPAAGSFL